MRRILRVECWYIFIIQLTDDRILYYTSQNSRANCHSRANCRTVSRLADSSQSDTVFLV